MPKILVLANSGFGKTTSIGKIEPLGIKGLDPKETYIISCTSKPLPFPGSNSKYPITKLEKNPDSLKTGQRIISSNPKQIQFALECLVKSPYKNVVVDDINYIMQDWYMDNALATGWDAPKKIGFFMGQIFKALEALDAAGKNIFVLAHGEEAKNDFDGRTYLKMKTTGKMVNEYLTPEGKFDVVLLGHSKFDSAEKKVEKFYLTNETEMFSSAKSPYGMFEELFIPNDLGYVLEKVNEYYK